MTRTTGEYHCICGAYLKIRRATSSEIDKDIRAWIEKHAEDYLELKHGPAARARPSTITLRTQDPDA